MLIKAWKTRCPGSLSYRQHSTLDIFDVSDCLLSLMHNWMTDLLTDWLTDLPVIEGNTAVRTQIRQCALAGVLHIADMFWKSTNTTYWWSRYPTSPVCYIEREFKFWNYGKTTKIWRKKLSKSNRSNLKSVLPCVEEESALHHSIKLYKISVKILEGISSEIWTDWNIISIFSKFEKISKKISSSVWRVMLSSSIPN